MSGEIACTLNNSAWCIALTVINAAKARSCGAAFDLLMGMLSSARDGGVAATFFRHVGGA